jgi:hypothetical protein
MLRESVCVTVQCVSVVILCGNILLLCVGLTAGIGNVQREYLCNCTVCVCGNFMWLYIVVMCEANRWDWKCTDRVFV